jgi:tetratricopeptide (TPR) repeat protein
MSSPNRRRNIIQPIRRASTQTVLLAGKVWRNIDIRKPESWLSTLVSLLLRIGTLILIVTLIALVWRIFKNDGFTIEPFSMPKTWQDNGFTGDATARQLLDVYLAVKKKGNSVKDDKTVAEGPDNAELNVSVMGFGISLRSIAFHLRELMGRPNQLVRGEMMEIDSSLVLYLRMTGHATQQFREKTGGNKEIALQNLMLQAGEAVLGNTDPYRLSLYYIRNKNYIKARETLLKMLAESRQEKHWALFGLGVLEESENKYGESIGHLKQALEVKPDFALCYQRMSGLYNTMDSLFQALECAKKSLELNPSDSTSWNAYAFALNAAKRYPESDEAFKKVGRLTHNDPFWMLNWLGCLVERGDTNQAHAVGADMLRHCPDPGSRCYVEGFIADFNGDKRTALQCYEKAVGWEPDNAFYVRTVIQRYFTMKDYRKAIDTGASTAIGQTDQNGRSQSVWNYVAMSYNFIGKPDSALYWVNQSIAVEPNTGYPYSTLAETYAFQGKTELFYTYLEQAFKMHFRKKDIDGNSEPYKRFVSEKRYQDLLNRY